MLRFYFGLTTFVISVTVLGGCGGSDSASNSSTGSATNTASGSPGASATTQDGGTSTTTGSATTGSAANATADGTAGTSASTATGSATGGVTTASSTGSATTGPMSTAPSTSGGAGGATSGGAGGSTGTSTSGLGSKPDGADCGRGDECESGVCEGPGCGDSGGVCVPLLRACTDDLRQYCGCDGETFNGSGSCPNNRYQSMGACATSGATCANAGESCQATPCCDGTICDGESSSCIPL